MRFLYLVLFLSFSLSLARADDPLVDLLSYQAEQQERMVQEWIDFSPAFVNDDHHFGGSFYEQPSAFYSPLMSANLLKNANTLLRVAKTRPLTSDEKYAIWLATTQVFANMQNSAIQVKKWSDRLPYGDSRAKKAREYSESLNKDFADYAMVLLPAITELNPELAHSKHLMDPIDKQISEIKKSGRISFTHFFTLTNQGGSMTWQEPYFDDYKRIIKLAQHESPQIRALALSKLAQLRKYTGSSNARLVNNDGVNKILSAIAVDSDQDFSLRGLANYTLITTDAKSDKLPAIGEITAPRVSESSVHDLGEHIATELLAEAPRKTASEREGRQPFPAKALNFVRTIPTLSCIAKLKSD